jgi:predicted nucleic acid-binding protein
VVILREKKLDGIISFDEDFDEVKDIKRVEKI